MHIKAKDFFCDLTDRVKKNIYIQIYSSNIPISRIFFYNLNGKGKITIESLRMNLDEKEIVKFVKKILDKLNLKNNIKTESLISSFKKKYFLISKKDDETIQKFINETASSNLIHGNWLEHGRDQKIDYILKQMDF